MLFPPVQTGRESETLGSLAVIGDPSQDIRKFDILTLLCYKTLTWLFFIASESHSCGKIYGPLFMIEWP